MGLVELFEHHVRQAFERGLPAATTARPVMMR
jgi:hypothetical protein